MQNRRPGVDLVVLLVVVVALAVAARLAGRLHAEEPVSVTKGRPVRASRPASPHKPTVSPANPGGAVLASGPRSRRRITIGGVSLGMTRAEIEKTHEIDTETKARTVSDDFDAWYFHVAPDGHSRHVRIRYGPGGRAVYVWGLDCEVDGRPLAELSVAGARRVLGPADGDLGGEEDTAVLYHDRHLLVSREDPDVCATCFILAGDEELDNQFRQMQRFRMRPSPRH